ncbi:transporter substrate-binding domain-containing protein [Pseudoalteromonas shioyasakiensis]|uniref:transporter substrate-binding domain-containing protein n=1 Tax=Pseudoalteromonas shioyasakiensis TaxID=1190813 RepID=UPI0021178205|nr:transporter substrate-binding domain-containing protein [Pseudoalteromonas shioyasakiensis]MCQ8876723.1 transporter substrate-binding domain-containing protein [Pseudoalteromonas shioyasakiensis]
MLVSSLSVLLCSLCANSQTVSVNQQPLKVIYPKPERAQESENWYPLVLLKFALEHSGRDHTLESSVKMVQSRSLKELEQGDLVNVAWSMTSIERERVFNPVRIPIYKGLYGLRLLLTTQDKLAKFANVTNLYSLRNIDFIQGHDWPDTVIIRDNGLSVSTSTTYEALYNMLLKGRGDAFPRSILEVDWELEQLGQQTNVQVVPNIALSYPAAIYYFVNSKRPDIHHAIQSGLEKMHENGEFDRLFTQYFADTIKNANLDEKTIVRLKNTHMSKLTPLENNQLWFKPN